MHSGAPDQKLHRCIIRERISQLNVSDRLAILCLFQQFDAVERFSLVYFIFILRDHQCCALHLLPYVASVNSGLGSLWEKRTYSRILQR